MNADKRRLGFGGIVAEGIVTWLPGELLSLPKDCDRAQVRNQRVSAFIRGWFGKVSLV